MTACPRAAGAAGDGDPARRGGAAQVPPHLIAPLPSLVSLSHPSFLGRLSRRSSWDADDDAVSMLADAASAPPADDEGAASDGSAVDRFARASPEVCGLCESLMNIGKIFLR